MSYDKSVTSNNQNDQYCKKYLDIINGYNYNKVNAVDAASLYELISDYILTVGYIPAGQIIMALGELPEPEAWSVGLKSVNRRNDYDAVKGTLHFSKLVSLNRNAHHMPEYLDDFYETRHSLASDFGYDEVSINWALGIFLGWAPCAGYRQNSSDFMETFKEWYSYGRSDYLSYLIYISE